MKMARSMAESVGLDGGMAERNQTGAESSRRPGTVAVLVVFCMSETAVTGLKTACFGPDCGSFGDWVGPEFFRPLTSENVLCFSRKNVFEKTYI